MGIPSFNSQENSPDMFGNMNSEQIPNNQNQETQQYGDEFIRNIDKVMVQETGETMVSDNQQKQNLQQQYADQQKQQNPVQPQPQANIPKYFGYTIPPVIAANFNFIRANKGKGDPSSSRTWMLVLLDRMLKMRSTK